VDDEELDLRLREDGFDGVREADQCVDGGDEHVLDPAVLQFRGDTEPALGPLGLTHPGFPELLVAGQGEGQGQVDGLRLNMAPGPHLPVDGVQSDDGGAGEEQAEPPKAVQEAS